MIWEKPEQIFIDINCPRCNMKNKYEVFSEIQSDIDVRAKQKLLDGRLFAYRCEKCGLVTNAPYEIFYYNTKSNALVYFIEPSEVENVCATMSEMVKNAKKEWSELIVNCQKRVVYHSLILQEKAKIFEEGMDDRVIEIIKVIYVNEECCDGSSPNKHILFDIENGVYCFKLFIDGAFTTVDFPHNIYNRVKGSVGGVLENDQNYIIDKNWAVNFMEKCEIQLQND